MAQTFENKPFNLKNYEWKNRLVLIFSETDSTNLYKQQLAEIGDHRKGFEDRDLVVFHLFRNALSFGGDRSIPEADVRQLFNEYDIRSEPFTVILIGKDGTEKLRRTSVIETEKLFSVIDAMPMRQQEMRNQGGDNEKQE